jgi:hypothetical protein
MFVIVVIVFVIVIAHRRLAMTTTMTTTTTTTTTTTNGLATSVAEHSKEEFIYVADSQLCSEENFEIIAEHGGRYIRVVPRNLKTAHGQGGVGVREDRIGCCLQRM